MYREKSQLRQTAGKVIFTGTIVESIAWGIILLFSLETSAIFGVPQIILLWTARKNTLKGSYRWSIYGMDYPSWLYSIIH